MSSLSPLWVALTRLAWLGWSRLRLAMYRRALKELVHPMHPDRHYIELRVAQLERLLWR